MEQARSGFCLLTAGQKRWWALERTSSFQPFCHVSAARRIHGHLDLYALSAALTRAFSEFDALRARIGMGPGGTPILVFSDAPSFGNLQHLALAPEELDRTLERLIEERFDVAQSCARVHLLRLGDTEHVLLLVAHRIAVDEASLQHVWRSLFRALQTQASDAPPPSRAGAALALGETLGNHLRRMARRQNSPAAASPAQLEVRLSPLRGDIPVLDLPLSGPRPSVFSGRGETVSRRVPRGTSTRLAALATSLNVGIGDVLLTAFLVWVSERTRSEDLAVGVEERGETGEVGPLARLAVVRVSLPLDLPFADAVRRTATQVATIGAAPPAELVELMGTLGIPEEPSRSPLFQIAFRGETSWVHPERVAGLRILAYPCPLRLVPADLVLRYARGPEGLEILFDHLRGLFEPRCIAEMIDGFLVTLEAIPEAKDTVIGRLPVMTAHERERVLSAVDQRPCDFERPAHQMFQERATENGDACAIFAQDQCWSYARLDRESNQLAQRLKLHGVGADVLVAIYCERTPRMVVAVLAVLKAGGAYVPLDPAHPAARTHAILADAAPRVLITESTLTSPLEAVGQTSIVYLDDDSLDQESGDPPTLRVEPHSLAYVIFTSGSTGRPKGVGIEHRALTNFLASMSREPGFTAKDRILAVTTLSFDIAGLELLLPLSVGGSLEMVDRMTAVNASALAARLQDPAITLMQATPATWRMLLEAGWPGRRGLKILCGGEAFPPDLVVALLKRADEVWNMYGPTETTVWSTAHRLHSADPPVSIGRPIDNTSVYILNSLREPVPWGALGEICIGGDGVARGYYGRPDLTEQRFHPDPFRGNPYRLYQTGDLGRFLPDGTLACLGRVDFQVKIRGYRIELGEIEQALLKCPSVEQTVVTAWEPTPGDKRLVAYWVSNNPGGDSEVASIRKQLEEKLPSYMVPGHYVPLPFLPLTPSGKVDRKALPPPMVGSLPPPRGRAPANDLEVRVHGVFANVLQVLAVDVEASFFDSGGDSILAVRLCRELNRALGMDMRLSLLFAAPSVRALAAQLAQSGTGVPPSRLVVLQQGTGPNGLFCISGIALYQHLARALPQEISVYGIFIPSEARVFDAENLRHGKVSYPTVEELGAEYVTTIREQQAHGPYRIAGISFGGVLAFEIAQQLSRAGETVSFLGLFDSLLPQAYGHDRRVEPLRILWSLARNPARRLVARKLLVTRLLRLSPDQWAPAELETLRDTAQDLALFRYLQHARPYPGSALIVGAEYRDPNQSRHPDPAAGWTTLIQGTITRFLAPGGHLSMLDPPNVTALAQHLIPYLTESNSI